MGISISGIVNSLNTKQSMSLSGREPDWSLIPGAGKSSKSKAEFMDEIKKLARRAAETASRKELEYQPADRICGLKTAGLQVKGVIRNESAI